MDKNPQAYRQRSYRNKILKNKFRLFNVTIRETDLFISSDIDLKESAYQSTYQQRCYLETYIEQHPLFLKSLDPLEDDSCAPPIVRDMLEAAKRAGVGPMAAVAGAMADHVGKELRRYSRNVIIENGGDIFMDAEQDLQVGIFAGPSPFNDKIILHVKREEFPLGVCTSSGTIGHSLSFGKADAVCVKATTAAIADAAATAIGNRLKTARDIPLALEEGMKIRGLLGIVIIMNDRLGAIGQMELSGS